MGIQDRDYYCEKHKEASKGSGPDFAVNQTIHRRHGKSHSSGIRYLLFPVLAIAVLWYGADVFLKYQEARKISLIPAPVATIPQAQQQPNNIAPISGGIVLKTDPQGHFRGTVLVNNVPNPAKPIINSTKNNSPAAERRYPILAIPSSRLVGN